MTSLTFFLLFIPILAVILLTVNLILATHNPYEEKASVFECGYHSFLAQNRIEFSISFFIFALLFLLFDLEILLVFPYAVSADVNGIFGLIIMLLFFLVLVLGFVFELGKNALSINSRQESSYKAKSNPILPPKLNTIGLNITKLNPVLASFDVLGLTFTVGAGSLANIPEVTPLLSEINLYGLVLLCCILIGAIVIIFMQNTHEQIERYIVKNTRELYKMSIDKKEYEHFTLSPAYVKKTHNNCGKIVHSFYIVDELDRTGRRLIGLFRPSVGRLPLVRIEVFPGYFSYGHKVSIRTVARLNRGYDPVSQDIPLYMPTHKPTLIQLLARGYLIFTNGKRVVISPTFNLQISRTGVMTETLKSELEELKKENLMKDKNIKKSN